MSYSDYEDYYHTESDYDYLYGNNDDNYNCIKSDRKSDGHTFRANILRNYQNAEYTVDIKRPYNKDGIVVTHLDSLIGSISLNRYWNISLRKGKLFDRFISEIEEIANNKKVTYDKGSNMNLTHYFVPSTGLIINSKQNNSNVNFGSVFDNDYNVKERFITIGFNTYSNKYQYKKVKDSLVKINIPITDYNTLYSDNEQRYLPTKFSVGKNNINMTFHHTMTISSLIICPETLIFERIHGDNSNCVKGCSKNKHTISVLKNDPGYITRFNLYYRSSKTHGKWINHGIYQGCSALLTPVKVSFDPVEVDELRIEPIDYVTKFDKVKIHAVGEKLLSNPVADNIVVEYIVKTPRDGKYSKRKICDSCHRVDKDIKFWQFRHKNSIKPRYNSVSNMNYDEVCDLDNYSDFAD